MKITEFIVENLLRKNLILYKLSWKLYNNLVFKKKIEKDRKKFFSKIKKIEPIISKVVDTSYKPDINVIKITIDCLRNDHMSYNGYERETTPFIDSLKGYRTTMISPSSWTYPALASILTGLYPHNHGAILNGKIRKFDIKGLRPLKRGVITINELLYLLGFNTYSIAPIDLAIYATKGRWCLQELIPLSNAEFIISNVIDWISNNMKENKNFFAHVHFGDLHEPINPPKKFRNYFGKIDKLPNIENWAFQKPETQRGREFEKYKENKILLYDNTLRYVDHILERFYEFLEDQGLLDSTVVIITTDHGEEFWDHAELEAKHFYDVRGYAGIGHGHSVFNELIQVPLIMHGPNVPNRQDDKLVSGVDIVPTVLDLLEIQHHIFLDGLNIFKAPTKRVLISENTIHGYEKRALIYNNYKFIYSQDDDVSWIFNLKKDPYERNPIVDEELSKMFMSKLHKLTSEKMILWKV